MGEDQEEDPRATTSRERRSDIESVSPAARLLAIGRDGGERLPEPYRTMDHADLLYGDDGLPV